MGSPRATRRRAEGGRCPVCGIKTMRGELEDGSVIEAEVGDLGPADELRALMAGLRTVRHSWHHGIELNLRTPRDMKLNPAGFRDRRIWKEHRCP